MKIDPVTYEVDVKAGTHPLYVWEAPVRVWHWVTVVTMAVMIVTGYLIGAPVTANLGDTWATYDMSYIRAAHFCAGMVFAASFLGRLYWGLVGNRYSRMILVPPLLSACWWKMLFEQVKYYLFLRPHAPEYAGLRSAPCSLCLRSPASASSSRGSRFTRRPGVGTRAG